MKRFFSWVNRKVSKNDTPSGRATGGGIEIPGRQTLQHGGESDSLLQLPTGEVNSGQAVNDSDSGTGSDLQNPARHQILPISSPPFMVLGDTSSCIKFYDLRKNHPSILDQITMVINAKPLRKDDITNEKLQYWNQTFLTSLSVNGPPQVYYPLLPSTVDGTVNYTEHSSGIATSQIWTSRSLFMYQFEDTNQYVIMALNLSAVDHFYLLTVDPNHKDTEPMVSFKSTSSQDFPKSDSKNGQVFAPGGKNDLIDVHLTTQCGNDTYVLIETDASTSNSRYKSDVVYKALSAEKYNKAQNNGLTLSFINPDIV